MEKNHALEKTLQDILAIEDFDRLAPFKEAASWTAMTPTERDILALSFVTQGESQLKNGDNSAFCNFDLAVKVAPKNVTVLFRQALAYAVQNQNMRCQTAACTTLQELVALDPQYFGAWRLWGNILVNIGILQGEAHYFHEAHQKFSEAEACPCDCNSSPSTEDSSTPQADFYWHWGLCAHHLGKLSGEACDFHVALEKYRQAAEQGLQSADFWNDYGDALVELAHLIGRKELLFEAVDLYNKAIEIAPEQYQSWFNLARSFQLIFECDHEEADFNSAHESFSRAAELDDRDVDLWLNWGQLHTYHAKSRQCIESLQNSLEKFVKADACEPNHALVLRYWGEAQMLYGAYNESGETLREAEAKIVKSIEIDPESPQAWMIYGSCLNELGRYFTDDAYFLQAIDKFRYGLSLDKNNPALFYGMSFAYLSVGELLADPAMIEQSVQCYARVVEFGGAIPPKFWNDWGVALMKLAQLTHDQKIVESAIEKFEQVILPYGNKDNKREVELEWMYNYGCAFDFLGDFTQEAYDYEQAIQILTKVLEQDPTYIHARYNLALALSHLGELNDDIECFHTALQHFEVLLAEDPEDEMAWNDWGLTLMNLAHLVNDPLHPEQSQQLYEESEHKLGHAIALGCTEAYYNLACLYALNANYSAAMHYLERSETAGILPGIEDLMHDEWLASLRDTSDFKHFIALLSNKCEKEKP